MLKPALILAFVLTGYAASHIDDGDALLYQTLARGADWFVLQWTPTHYPRFSEHLPIIVWPAKIFGPFVRVFSAACTFLAWFLAARWLSRAGHSLAAAALFIIVAATESYVGTQTTARMEPVFLLAMVGACTFATTRHFAVAGLLSGVALLWRGPFALLLGAMVPLALWAAQTRPKVRDVVVYTLCATAFPLAYYAADTQLGPGDSIAQYLHSQVLASLQGERTDGDPRRYAALLTIGRRFWPGLALLPFAFFQRTRLTWFATAWSVLALIGLSLGKRHVVHHALVVYPGLFLLSALGAEQLLKRLPPWRPLTNVLLAASIAVSMILPLIRSRERCDFVQFVSLRAAGHCPTVYVATPNGAPDWQAATRLIDHGLGRDFAFITTAESPPPSTCSPLVVSDEPLPHLHLERAGKRWSLFTRQ